MQGTSVITFKLTPSVIKDPFYVGECKRRNLEYTFWDNAETTSNRTVSLDTMSCEDLTIMLHNEITNYDLNNNLLRGLCDDEEDPYSVKADEEGEWMFVNYTLNDSSVCHNHTSNNFQRSIIDVLSRDSDAFSGLVNVDLYAVVLIHKGEYYGHIYTWKYNNYCVAVGIRSRIDIAFLRATEEGALKNVANYLLEGVRRFAAINSCHQIVIPYPLTSMLRILRSHGFVSERLTHGDLGKGPGLFDPSLNYFPRTKVCRECNVLQLPANQLAVLDTYRLLE